MSPSSPRLGECCGCRKAPTPLLRFNIYLEDRRARKQFTQLLCEDCATEFLRKLIGQSVEKTPQAELDELRIVLTGGSKLNPKPDVA